MKQILLGLALFIGMPFYALGMEMPQKPTINKSLLDSNYGIFYKIIENGESIEAREFLDLLFNMRVQKIDLYFWITSGHRILTGCPLILEQTKPAIRTLKELAFNRCIKDRKLRFEDNGIIGTIEKKVGYRQKTGQKVISYQKIRLPSELSALAFPALLGHEDQIMAKHLLWHFKKFGSFNYCLDIINNLSIEMSIKIIRILKDSLQTNDIEDIHYALQGKETDFSQKPRTQLFLMLLNGLIEKQCENAQKYVSLCSNHPALMKQFTNMVQLRMNKLPFQSHEEKKEWMEMPNCMLGLLYASRPLKPNQSNEDKAREIEDRTREIKDCCVRIALKEVFGYIVDIQKKYNARESEPSPFQVIKDSFFRRNL